jgi:hypothetical protein
MIDFILEKFTDITLKCLERNSKSFGVEKKEVQLVFKFNNIEDVEYLIMNNYKPQKVLTFLEVLGVKLDFKGYSLFVPKFINGALNRFCVEHEIEKNKVAVVLSFNATKNKLILWLYNGNQPIKEVELESLFDGEDMLTE